MWKAFEPLPVDTESEIVVCSDSIRCVTEVHFCCKSAGVNRSATSFPNGYPFSYLALRRVYGIYM